MKPEIRKTPYGKQYVFGETAVCVDSRFFNGKEVFLILNEKDYGRLISRRETALILATLRAVDSE